MKCWMVREEATRGIKIEKGPEASPVFKLRNKSLGVSDELSRLFKERADVIEAVREAVAKGDTNKMRALVTTIMGREPQEFEDTAQMWAEENPDELWLSKAEVLNGVITVARKRSEVALVHIATTTTGQQWLTANSFEEALEEGYRPYVIRKYHGFPSAGMGPLLEDTGPLGEPQGLYLMYAKASFRICRDQRPPTLVVVWPGSTLRCFEPTRERKKQDEHAA